LPGARIEERKFRAKMKLAEDMLKRHQCLTQSALGQKAEDKPWGLPPRERSQGRAAMRGREVAFLPSEMELHLGWTAKRASSRLAKFDLSAPIGTGRAAAHAVSGALTAPVAHAITSRRWNLRFTDEVPRRPGLKHRVSLGYKKDTKGQGHASETGTAFPRPRPKGCQQRQSRGLLLRLAAGACSERQNLRVPDGPLWFMGPVSPVSAATKWRERTSSCQLAGLLSNSPQQPKSGRTAVRSR